ncbi:1-phosphofructokinase family hexose kinase [Paraburkholderia sp. UYCP14C]|uniref:1-phosphofructokinase family hexose kinase n=1 Tax=Paraburkholderia sp. UYCP14C TaxID=2511130 RepID=UPI00101EE029|nr:1-phosphofructokinase family hexose kinase [Paraburkholderia sp. UYCP14C]RZF28973.1 1-phosphofructokinase family hexose kinase [Paraburkholderia sp. UYCP14C]
MAEILTLTLNPAVDVATSVDRIVDTRKLRCSTARRDPGGGGINVARVVHRLGADCEALYMAGGVPGLTLSAMIEAEGLHATRIGIAGETRENFSVRETSSGREFRFVLPGPLLAETEWQACLRHIGGLAVAPRYLVLSGSVPPGVPDDIYARVATIVRQHDTRVVLDTSGAPLAAALAAGVFLVKPSLSELCTLAGHELDDDAQRLDAARKIVRDGGAAIVALTLGDQGALVVTADRALRVPGFAVPVSSSIGAGDSFLAAMVWSLNRGMKFDETLRYAVAAASASLLTEGTRLCDREQIERIHRELELAGADIVSVA